MSWESLAWVGGKIALKVAINMVVPGSSLIVDAAGVINDCRKGDMSSAVVGAAFIMLDIATCGIGSAGMEAAKAAGKAGAIQAAREATKTAAKEGGKAAGKVVGKEFGKKLAEDIAKGTISKLSKQVFEEEMKTSFESVLFAVATGALKGEGKEIIINILDEAGEIFSNMLSHLPQKKHSKLLLQRLLSME